MSKRPYEDHGPNANYPKRLTIAQIVPDRDGGDERVGPSPPLAHGDYTIAWICALHLELAASRAMLDEVYQQLPAFEGDDNTYTLGRIKQHNIVMVCLPGQYGTNNAAVVTTDLKRSFPNIRATLMVGIGGGAPGAADVRLGDVVVGTRVMQHDMGKDVGNGLFEITADPKIPARRLLSAVTNLRALHERDTLSARVTNVLQTRLPNHYRPLQPDQLFLSSYDHPPGAPTCDSCDTAQVEPRRLRVSEDPQIHYGGIASGNSVIRNAKKRDHIAKQFSVLCFEMEAAGMTDSDCLPIRGICDYSDSHKNKEWQHYAAATAAAYARELLETLPRASQESCRTATRLDTLSKPDVVDNQALERRQLLLDSLDFLHIDARKTTIRGAYAKTCRWFLQHPKYRDWLDPSRQSQHHGFLWMRGKAGAGKSTMMKFLYLEMKRRSKNPDTGVASFFFNARGDILERSISGMYRSLLLQLLQSFPDIQFVLDDTDIVPANQRDCPDLNALKELLRSAVMALGQRSFICFIDALDECDEQEVRDMVQFFEDLAETTTNDIQFRVCFSSRPYPYIGIRRGALLSLEEESGHAEDLASYVKSNLRIEDSSLLEELQSQILLRAAGIFLWIVLVVDILNQEEADGGLALRKKLSEIPAGLSDLFKRILLRDNNAPERLLLCILWVLCARRPLTPAEFRHALWVGLLKPERGESYQKVDSELPDVQNRDSCVRLVTSSSKGLVEVTKSNKPTVQFIHESVRDFLVKERGLQDLWPELGFEWESRGHERLRHCCDTYLCLPGVKAIVHGAAEGFPSDSTKELHSLLEYASQQVLYHANEAAAVIPQDNFLSRFFASDGIQLINLFEKYKARRYSPDASSLYILADKGLEHLVRSELKREKPGHVQGERYKYPLFAALANGHQGAVAALLGLSSTICDGADIMGGLKHKKDLMNYKGRTPVSWAAQEGRLGLLQALVQGGAVVNHFDEEGRTPLARASLNGHEVVVRLLLKNGADVDAHDYNDEESALINASLGGHEAVVRLLIEHGANIEAHYLMTGGTALTWASYHGHEAIARLLIENKANLNASDHSGRTPLIMASSNGHEAVARLLIENGADVNTTGNTGQNALQLASMNGNEAIAQLLIENKAVINACDNAGQSALILALSYGHKAIARLLIAKGADISVTDRYGQTALFPASLRGDEATMQLLIQKGADVNLADVNGQTALIWTVIHGHEATARLLIQNGADINHRDAEGKTALIWTAVHGHDATARLLIQRGADVNHQDAGGKTALIWSSLHEQVVTTRLLIQNGAHVNHRDTEGKTALAWALWKGNKAVVQVLKHAIGQQPE